MRSNHHVAYVAAFLAAIGAGVGVAARSGQSARPAAAAWDLGQVFQKGALFQDRNGDGVIDFVAARLVVGTNADASDVAAAADVAARLGFETAAMNLPLTAEKGAVPIAIGAAGIARSGIAAGAVPTPAAGEGIVSVVDASGQPAIAIIGSDSAATRAAAEAFAGRLPHLWEPQGPTVADVADAVRARLSSGGVEAASISVPQIAVKAAADALTRVVVAASLSNAADVQKAQAALRRAGGTPLSFTGAEVVRVRLQGPAGAAVDVDVARTKPADRGPIPARPAAAKARLSLGSLFTNDGFLGDSDNNLIPDRVDVLLSPAGPGTEGTIDLAARLGLE